jgi:hypothetical protein
MRKSRWLIVPLIAGAALVGAAAPGLGSGLFEASEPLEIRIEAPWRHLTREMVAGRSVEGRLHVLTRDLESANLRVTITTRGTARLDVCDFPPLTLEFQPEEIPGSPFLEEDTIHLTTQCRKDIRFRDHLVLEYLSYQAYRLLDEPALGARLASVEYLGTEGKRAAKPARAFFVEDLGLAAERFGGVWLEPTTVEVDALAADSLALLGLFQFMLGNTDWSVLRGPPGEPCCHNVAILGPERAGVHLIPVPFDLDCTGLVDPPYAAPAAGLPIRTVRQRVYRGFCKSNTYLPGAIARFRAQRAQILALFEDEPLLSTAAKRRTRKYLDSFFEILEDPEKLQKRILDHCR